MDKYDLIAWEHTGAVAKIIDQIRPDDYPWKKTLYDGPGVLKMFCHGFVGLDKFNKAYDFYKCEVTDMNVQVWTGVLLPFLGTSLGAAMVFVLKDKSPFWRQAQ